MHPRFQGAVKLMVRGVDKNKHELWKRQLVNVTSIHLILLSQILRVCRQARFIAATVALILHDAQWRALQSSRIRQTLHKKRQSRLDFYATTCLRGEDG
jgi:hypothetical protein